MNTGKAELLSPAGNFEKLEAAVLYGADAVYLAGKRFGMRAAADNFSDEELKRAVDYAHERNVKIYVTVNIMPRTGEYPALEEYIGYLRDIGVDAAIVSDIGVLSLIKRVAPKMDIHISTQASAVSAASCIEWYKLGASRVVLARELTLSEIKEIKKNIPEELELEAFVHGSMCISYSGRCLLSNYFTGRDANHGACAQPCRWIYPPVKTISLSEGKREEGKEVLYAEEHGGDTFFMSSNDTSMIRHVPELEESGIASYKIEGRMKSAYYTAVVTNAYRLAIDSYRRDPSGYVFDEKLAEELDSVSHREYNTGFYFTSPHEDANTVTEHGYIRDKAYLATCIEDAVRDGDMYRAKFIQRNKMIIGDTVELLSPGKTGRAAKVTMITDENGEAIESTPHAGMIFCTSLPFEIKAGDILRGGN